MCQFICFSEVNMLSCSVLGVSADIYFLSSILCPGQVEMSFLSFDHILTLQFQILCRTTKDSPLVLNKPAVFAPAGNNSNFQSPPTGQPNPNVRRSSRLFGNSNSVKVSLGVSCGKY